MNAYQLINGLVIIKATDILVLVSDWKILTDNLTI